MRRVSVVGLLAVCMALGSFAFGCSGAESSSGGGSGDTEPGLGDGEIKGDGSRGGESGFGGATSGASADEASGSAPPGEPKDAARPGTSGSSSSGSVPPPPSTPTPTPTPTPKPSAGTLTAGVWDDNRNFDLFLGYRTSVTSSGRSGFLGLTEAEHHLAHGLGAALSPKQTLDIALVVDTTGSMGDEMRYLTTEFNALVSTIQAKYPGAAQRWSLVVYKDQTDEYLVRWFDFRYDTNELRTKLAAQSAGGGGDFPEAPDQAISIANRLAWRTSPGNARLMFWVADAPHHDYRAAEMTAALRTSRDKGIHIYPVASSGIDEFTELGMRSAAQITNGRYVFLTNDSGVGGNHKEPSTPCYFVTKLEQAILRMVDIEMSGTYREPAASEIIRTGGDPTNGACQVGGKHVVVY
jgi:hypothetical protein